MATRIIEYGGRDRTDGLAAIPAVVATQAAITATITSAQSAAFNAATNLVCVDSDEAVHVAFGTNPTATTDNFKVAAGDAAFFTVKSGDKVAVRTP